MAILEVNHIEKHFGKTQVLRDVSFSMEEGSALAIIGSSGSGKTTLLRCLNFLEKPNSGSISVNGEVLFDASLNQSERDADLRKKRLHFGMVFQSFNLFPQYTALENVMLAERLLAQEQPDFKHNKKEILAGIEEHAKQVTSNVLSSFNCILDPAVLKERLEYVRKHVETYRRNNPDGIVYFEDAHYHDADVRKLCIETVYSCVDILSMNEEELEYTLKDMYGYEVDIEDICSCVDGVEFLMKKFGIKKGIIVHTKDYAMFVGDPGKTDIESGLMYGMIMATAKAINGSYGTKEQIRQVLELSMSEKGLENRRKLEEGHYDSRAILVPTRYIDKPKYTIGLGDSFTGGVQMCF